MSLNLPNLVGASHNDAGTFALYDPSKIVGDTSPYLALPPQPSDNFFAQVLMMAVAIYVSMYLGPEIFNAIGAETTYTAGTLEGSTMTLTSTTTGLNATAAHIVSGAAAAAGGSIAGQAVGIGLGLQSGFNFKQVALSALSGGVSGGLADVDFTGSNLSSLSNTIVRAGVASALTQGVGIATGLQRSFNWNSVTASAVGAGVGAAVGRELGDGFGGRLATGLIAGTATAVMRGGRISAQQIAVDSFGNSIGASLANSASGAAQTTSGGDGEANSAQQSFRLDEISRQNSQHVLDTRYGWNTGNDGLGLIPQAYVGTVGMRYQGARAPMFDDTRIFSDSPDPSRLIEVGQNGQSTAFFPVPPVNPAFGAGGAAGIGGYEVVRPRGAGAAPGYDIIRDAPTSTPGYLQASPSLGLGAPGRQNQSDSWIGLSALPLPMQVGVGLLSNILMSVGSGLGGKSKVPPSILDSSGSLPSGIGGLGTPIPMPPSTDPNGTAESFARGAFNGQRPDKLVPILSGNSWVAKLPDGTVVTYRVAGDASQETKGSTATVEINSQAIKLINNGIPAKFKFPAK